MKLIDALREADKRKFPNIRKQFYTLSKSKWKGEGPFPTCAIGGANLVAGHARAVVRDGQPPVLEGDIQEIDKFEDRRELRNAFYYRGKGDCPAKEEAVDGEGCPAQLWDVREFIVHLYDKHRWSRTKIADHLEKILEEFNNRVEID